MNQFVQICSQIEIHLLRFKIDSSPSCCSQNSSPVRVRTENGGLNQVGVRYSWYDLPGIHITQRSFGSVLNQFRGPFSIGDNQVSQMRAACRERVQMCIAADTLNK